VTQELEDTLTRQIYARLFTGSYSDIAYTTPSKLVGSIFDSTYMPSLVISKGKSVYYDFSLAQNTSATLPLPENYTVGAKLYIAVCSDLRARLTYTSPTHGAGLKVLLEASDNTTDGTHAAVWTYQGDMTTFAVSVPSTAQGGATTQIQVFMYEIPDLEDFESYYDKQIGLGTSGDD
jgi:hypothetical protein